jgi:aspartate 1-decarboxylase
MRFMLKSKIHRARVTGADINYEGSITIDRKLLKEADILSYEQVHVLDISNGSRLVTYAIEGGDGEICLNGAAARMISIGDLVIILSYCQVDDRNIPDFEPKLVFVTTDNVSMSEGPLAETAPV